jgi:carboxypeptidase family protein/TonB-dependent receptor-like protein
MRQIGVSLICIWYLAIAGYGQTFRGAINGTVTDPSGAVVANANVKATDVATDVSITAVTTSDGAFSYQDLPLGTYKITVSALGFQSMTVDNVTVTAGSAYTLPVKLAVGSSGTTVEVSAAALTLDTTTAAQDNVLSTEAVQDVPMNGRDFTQFAAVQPGYGGYSVGGFGSLNGTRANQMNWQIDGVDNNDFWHNIPAVNQGGVSGIAGVIMPLDAIDEFSAQTESNAEGGRNAGGIVNVVLKSGTNQIHGSAYYFNRNEAYGAATPFFDPSLLASEGLPSKKPPLRNQNYGFSFGGPIIKDKTFYFISFEEQKYKIGLSGLNTEPSLAYQNAALTLLANAGVHESPISQQLMANLWPSFIDNLPLKTGNFFASNPSTGYSYNGVIKLDHNFTDKHHFSIRWFGGQGSQTAPLGGSAALATASSNLSYYFEKAPIHVYNYAATLNSVLTPRMSNQLLFGVNYFNQTFNDANHSFDTASYGLNLSPDATINGKPILGAPNLKISGFEQVGITPPEGRNDITGMLADILSYNVGRHQFRFGGEMRQGHVDEFYFRNSLGSFGFTGTYPGTAWSGTCASGDPTCALADFLAGDVSSSTIAIGDAERKVVVNGVDFFAQDAWQVTPRLNINLGLRWDYFGPLHSSNKDLAVFVPSAGGVKVQGNGIGSIFPPDRNNFAPRIGFAYKLTSRDDLVLRGGIGVFYDQINMNPFLDFRPPNNADGLEDNPAGPHPVSTYGANYLGAPSYNWETTEGPGHTQSIFPGVSTCVTGNVATDPHCGTSVFDVFSVNQNFRTPYFFNYNLNVEKSFGNGMAVWQVGYVGSEGRKLSIMLNINQLPGGATVVNPITGQATTNGNFITQFPNYGGINQLNSIGTSNYNALQTTLRLRAWHGLSTQLAYTWAHELDEISAYRGAIPFDSNNFQAEYGNGDFDTRHNFSATLTWDIPGSSRGPRWVTHGWSLNSLMTFHGGQPLDEVRNGYDIIGNPFAGVSHAFQKTASFTGVTWINPAAFCLPAIDGGTAPCSGPNIFGGDLRRNQIYGPGFSDVDLSVLKNIPITERVRAQFRVEFFNLFNRINLASGVGATNPGNGNITDTIGDFNGAPGIGPGEAFNMQLGLKILF